MVYLSITELCDYYDGADMKKKKGMPPMAKPAEKGEKEKMAYGPKVPPKKKMGKK